MTRPHAGALRLFTGSRRWPDALQRRLAWAVVAIALLVVLAMLYRVPLADHLWPQTRAQELREAAARALAQGRLTAADGTGARELYAAALALDPDRGEARAGLQRVADAALAQARSAMQAQRFEEAHLALRLARELAVPQPAADAVAEALRLREVEVAGIDTLLVRAARARHAGRLDGEDHAALPLYRRVLALQPTRTEALEGREDALSELLQRARQRIARGELAAAAAMVAQAREYDAGHIDLPDAQAALARAADRRRRQGARALQRGQLAKAAGAYRDAFAVDADDAATQAGLQQVAQAYAQRGERLAADFRFVEAERALAGARALAPQSPALAQAARHLLQARQAQARLHAPRTGTRRNNAQRVHQLLRDAAAAEARGDLLGPPGESAFDHLRTARALAPNDAAVRRASARLLPSARSCFENQLRGNRLALAQACLDARVQLGDGNASEPRRRLALRWIAVGDERLGAGEVDVATRAHAAARALDPEVPGLDALGERLRAAGAARN